MTLHSMERNLSHLQLHGWRREREAFGGGKDAERGSGIRDKALSQLDGKAALYILSIVTASDTVSSKMDTPFSPLFHETVSMRVSLPAWPSPCSPSLSCPLLRSQSIAFAAQCVSRYSTAPCTLPPVRLNASMFLSNS